MFFFIVMLSTLCVSVVSLALSITIMSSAPCQSCVTNALCYCKCPITTTVCDSFQNTLNNFDLPHIHLELLQWHHQYRTHKSGLATLH